jgi:hypothetical protein
LVPFVFTLSHISFYPYNSPCELSSAFFLSKNRKGFNRNLTLATLETLLRNLHAVCADILSLPSSPSSPSLFLEGLFQQCLNLWRVCGHYNPRFLCFESTQFEDQFACGELLFMDSIMKRRHSIVSLFVLIYIKKNKNDDVQMANPQSSTKYRQITSWQ